jgi:hypothetical protein
MAYAEEQPVWVKNEPGIYLSDSDGNPNLALVELPAGSGNVVLCVKRQISPRSVN